MRKSYTLLIILLLSKVIYCQNFLNSNSTPYDRIPFHYPFLSESLCVDSLENKYTFQDMEKITYSSSKFYFAPTPGTEDNFLFIKYDSLNNIKYYKKISTDSNNYIANKIIYFENYIYIQLFARFQCVYDNTTINTSYNMVFLKINPANGALVNSYLLPLNSGPIYSGTNTNYFAADHKIYLFSKAWSNFNYYSTPINAGNYVAVYDKNMNFIYAKNITDSITTFNGIINLNGCIYLLGNYKNVTPSFNNGFIIKFDSNFTIIKKIYYGFETFCPIQLNGNILFATQGGLSGTPYEDRNKIVLSIVDTGLNIIRNTTWGLTNSLYYNFRSDAMNTFMHLNFVNNKIVFCFASALSGDSLVGCNAFGKTTSNLFMYSLDTTLNCKNFIQVNNLDEYNTSGFNYYRFQTDMISFVSNRQLSFLAMSTNASTRASAMFEFYLNQHKYPLGKMPRGNLDAVPAENIVSLHLDKWLEIFYPDKTNYCVGDILKLAYKKNGKWDNITTFKLEASSDQNFPLNTIRTLGTWSDSTSYEDSIIYTKVKIPSIGGGLFYLRIRSIGPERISNLADTMVYIYGLPNVDAGKDMVICEGDTVSLEGNNFSNTFYWTSSIPNILEDSLKLNSKVLTRDSVFCVLHTKNNPGCENTDTVYIHVIPKINLKYSIDTLYPKCINTNLHLSLSTGYNDSMIVSWGDGTDTIIKNNSHLLKHNFNLSGLKTVIIKAIANQCTDSTGFTLMVREPIQIITSNDTIVCKGTFVNLRIKATGADSLFNYLLQTPSIMLHSSNGAFWFVPDSTTTFIIGAVDICSGDTIWKPITVTVRAPLKMGLYPQDTTVCVGAGVTARVTPTGGDGNYQYFLKKNNIILQTNTTGIFNITATTNEIYTIVLTDNCTVLNDSVTCNIKIFTPLQFTQTLPDLFLCSGVPTTLKTSTNQGSGTVTYQWFDAATNTTLSTSDSLLLTPFASSQIIVKVTDACTSIYDTAAIYVFATSGSTQLSTDVASGCVPLTVNFETPPLTYSNSQPCEARWDFGDGGVLVQYFDNSTTILKTKHTYPVEGVYPVEVKLMFKGKTTACLIFNTTLEALQVPVVKISVEPKKITLPKTQCTASVTTFNADSVVIDWGDGYNDYFISNLSLFTQTHDYDDTGHYTVRATAYNKNTCYTESFTSVYHADTFTCFIPNIFTPNKDGTNEVFKPIVNFCRSYELTIYNRWGEEIYNVNSTTSKNPQSLWTGEDVPPDTYIYSFRATDGDGMHYDFKGTVILVR